MTRLYLPPKVMSALPKNIVDDFILLQDDIEDIVAGQRIEDKVIEIGHIVDSKFVKYSFDDPKKEQAIREIELEYVLEYYNEDSHKFWLQYYPDNECKEFA